MAEQNTNDLCRLCLSASSPTELLKIFSPLSTLQQKLNILINTYIYEGDGYPEKICTACDAELDRIESLIRDFEKSRNKLLQSIKITAEGHLVEPENMDNVCLLCSSEVELLAFPSIHLLPFPAKLVIRLPKFREVLNGGVQYTEPYAINFVFYDKLLKNEFLPEGICTGCFQRLNDVGTFIDRARENEFYVQHSIETAEGSNPAELAGTSGGSSHQVEDVSSSTPPASSVEPPSEVPDTDGSSDYNSSDTSSSDDDSDPVASTGDSLLSLD